MLTVLKPSLEHDRKHVQLLWLGLTKIEFRNKNKSCIPPF